MHVVADGRAGHVTDDARAVEPLRQPGQLIRSDALHAWIRESHGVQHAAAKLGDAQRRMALPRLGCHRFRDDATEEIEVDDVIELPAEAGSTSSKENRVLEGGAEQIDRVHGRSSRGPRGPGTGASKSAPLETAAPRATCIPSSRAKESSAAAYATLGSPWKTRVYGDAAYRESRSAAIESRRSGRRTRAAINALGP